MVGTEQSGIGDTQRIRGSARCGWRASSATDRRLARRLNFGARRFLEDTAREGVEKQLAGLERTADISQREFAVGQFQLVNDRDHCVGQLARFFVENVPGNFIALLRRFHHQPQVESDVVGVRGRGRRRNSSAPPGRTPRNEYTGCRSSMWPARVRPALAPPPPVHAARWSKRFPRRRESAPNRRPAPPPRCRCGPKATDPIPEESPRFHRRSRQRLSARCAYRHPP